MRNRYRAVTSSYCKGAVGDMLVFDITIRQRNCVDMETRTLSVISEASARAVPTKDAKEFAQKEGLFFLETSALEGSSVETAFSTVLTEIFNIVNKKTLVPDEIKAMEAKHP
ncbi:hypothetical protein C5167_039916 [Papaver somniferum]|uniref:Uncharacterized protein n=1 Tax=Papaver somniferum TaxID=3469 RepID=A0A4Y7IH06_PAPSO|nr:hypothetical protein C5167_039916 [Papaver somniferum]